MAGPWEPRVWSRHSGGFAVWQDILPRIVHSANDSRRDLAADRDATASSFGPQLAWVGMGYRGPAQKSV